MSHNTHFPRNDQPFGSVWKIWPDLIIWTIYHWEDSSNLIRNYKCEKLESMRIFCFLNVNMNEDRNTTAIWRLRQLVAQISSVQVVISLVQFGVFYLAKPIVCCQEAKNKYISVAQKHAKVELRWDRAPKTRLQSGENEVVPALCLQSLCHFKDHISGSNQVSVFSPPSKCSESLL